MQDVSGVGRCSVTAVLPVLSVGGLACALLPTALLSSHTGGFGPVHRRDLADDMALTLARWFDLGLRFDAVYVGYAASARQLRLVGDALPQLLLPEGKLFVAHDRVDKQLPLGLPQLLLPEGKLFVDPVMGDAGRRYSYCDEALLAGFLALCGQADVIFPNRTEAALLLGKPVAAGDDPLPPDPRELTGLGCKAAVLTGIADGAGGIGVRAEEKGSAPYETFRPRYPGAYPGTGDLLASAVIAGVMAGASLPAACELACDFLDDAFGHTARFNGEPRHGLAFEPALHRFGRRVYEAFRYLDSNETGQPPCKA